MHTTTTPRTVSLPVALIALLHQVSVACQQAASALGTATGVEEAWGLVDGAADKLCHAVEGVKALRGKAATAAPAPTAPAAAPVPAVVAKPTPAVVAKPVPAPSAARTTGRPTQGDVEAAGKAQLTTWCGVYGVRIPLGAGTGTLRKVLWAALSTSAPIAKPAAPAVVAKPAAAAVAAPAVVPVVAKPAVAAPVVAKPTPAAPVAKPNADRAAVAAAAIAAGTLGAMTTAIRQLGLACDTTSTGTMRNALKAVAAPAPAVATPAPAAKPTAKDAKAAKLAQMADTLGVKLADLVAAAELAGVKLS